MVLYNDDMVWVSCTVLHNYNKKYMYTGNSDRYKIKSAVYRRDLEVIVYYTDKQNLSVKTFTVQYIV